MGLIVVLFFVAVVQVLVETTRILGGGCSGDDREIRDLFMGGFLVEG
jgi:hypothetical protein